MADCKTNKRPFVNFGVVEPTDSAVLHLEYRFGEVTPSDYSVTSLDIQLHLVEPMLFQPVYAQRHSIGNSDVQRHLIGNSDAQRHLLGNCDQ